MKGDTFYVQHSCVVAGHVRTYDSMPPVLATGSQHVCHHLLAKLDKREMTEKRTYFEMSPTLRKKNGFRNEGFQVVVCTHIFRLKGKNGYN